MLRLARPDTVRGIQSNRLGDMMIPSRPSQARSCRAKSRHPSSKRKVDGCLELDDVGSNGHCERSEAISSSRCSMTVAGDCRSEEHTSELQSLMRISYAVFCLKK